MSDERSVSGVVGKAPDEKTSFAVTGVSTAERPALEPAGFRIVLVSFLAAGIGLVAGCIAFLLYKLIGLFTNLFFYGHLTATFMSARHNHLGWWVIPIPVIGGLIVGVMAKYGSPRIKGPWDSGSHGSSAGESQQD